MKIANADGDTPTIVTNARSNGADLVPGWDQPLTDQELDDIEATVKTAISKKRRSFSGIGNDDDDCPDGTRRRLPGSFSLQHSMQIKLPVMIFGGQITYSRSATVVERAAAELLKKIDVMKSVMDQVIIGFDIEYRPTFQRGVPPRKTAVMQICGDNDHCHVMHVIHSGVPPSLKLILEDTTVLKVGAGIAGDARKVIKDYNVSVNGFQDLSELANQKLTLPHKRWGLASLSEVLINKQLEKSMKIRCGNWEAAFLSEQQLLYAATDAFVSWHLYQILRSLPDAQRNIESNELQPRLPSGNLRCVGGETRIVSVDRNVSFSRLASKIADLFPRIPSGFYVKYRLPDAGGVAPLVSVADDDDVRRMIQAHDKLEAHGKHARLWVFVFSDCSDGGGREDGGLGKDGDARRDVCGENEFSGRRGLEGFNGCGFEGRKDQEARFRGSWVGCSVVKNPVTGVAGTGFRDDPVRNMRWNEPILVKQLAVYNNVQDVSNTKMEFSARGGRREKCNGSHADLASRPQAAMDVLDRRKVGTHCLSSESRYNLVQFRIARPRPLTPRNGNLPVQTYLPTQILSRKFSHGLGICKGCSSHSITVPQDPMQRRNPPVVLKGDSVDASKNLRRMEVGLHSHLNRENIVPSPCTNPLAGRSNAQEPSAAAGRAWGAMQSSNRSQRSGASDARYQRVHPYHVRNHHYDTAEMESHLAAKAERRLSLGKSCPGLKNMSKQEQLKRRHPAEHTLTGLYNCLSNGSVSLMNSYSDCENPCSYAQGDYLTLRYANTKFMECNPAYRGISADVNGKPVVHHVSICPSTCLEVMNAQENVQSALNEYKHTVIRQTSPENFLNWSKCDSNIYKKPLPMDPLDSSDERLLPSDSKCTDSTGMRFNGKFPSRSMGISLSSYNNNISSSVDLSLHNLSLSSSKEVELSGDTSCATSSISNALSKPQTKSIDLMEFSTGPRLDESNGVQSDSSSEAVLNVEKTHVYEDNLEELSSGLSVDGKDEFKGSPKCSKVLGAMSTDLTAFYAHLASQGLQTIKTTDIECIKELGSGTYGTVCYGKWKGSDVAIKRLKSCCFTDGAAREDRLVADFWKEAHLLGQLHHPNIVAFYGVVSDGPVTSLATVTEYMVNGSLKQALRKKDRTIDRRKRLIIAMDAAFGMEYLHEKNIVHFDLKSHNLLVNMRDPQRPVCKIGDLGLSKIKQKTLVSGGVRGTIPWMAPELFNNNDNMVTEKVDVYSFGIVMWELLTGEEPYANLRSEDIIAGIIKGTLRPEIPSWCDPAWRSLMERCWSADVNSRPTFSDIAKELRAMSAAMNIK